MNIHLIKLRVLRMAERLLRTKNEHEMVLINMSGGVVQNIISDHAVLVVILEDYKSGDIPKPKDIFECGIGDVETNLVTGSIIGLACAMEGEWSSRSQRALEMAKAIYAAIPPNTLIAELERKI